MKTKSIFLAVVCLFVLGCQPTGSKPGASEPSLKTAQALMEKSADLYQEAVATYQKILVANPANAQACYDLGHLYDAHGAYDLAIKTLGACSSLPAQELLAQSYYKNGDYTEALSVFEKIGDEGDDHYLYAYAMTCEKHNLFGEALKLYKKMRTPTFVSLAQARMQAINALMEKTELNKLSPEIQKLIASAPSAEDFPEAGSVVLYVQENTVILENNTLESTEHCLVKILNERGKHLGEIEIGYDSTYEKVEIEFARTITPSGDVVSVGSKHIRDVSRYLNFPLYSNARAKIISMPEVAVGAFLEYKIKVTQNKMVADDQFQASYLLQGDSPIAHAEYHLKMPKGRKLHQAILNIDFAKNKEILNPVITQDQGQTHYSWVFDNIEQILPEPQMPPITEITPVILLSTFDSWQALHDWWWPLAKDKIQINDAMREKIAELTQGAATLKEKAKAIYSFCARDIRYVGVEYGQAGYEPHLATEIFANKYGDCKDQSILLISMLRAVGVKAYPVLIGTKNVPKLQRDFPTMLFNHCIVMAQIDGEDLFLDPTGETVLFGDLPQGDQDRLVFVCFEKEAKLMQTPKYPAAHNQVVKKTTLTLASSKEVLGRREIRAAGVFDQGQRSWLRYTMPSLVQETLRQRIQEMVPEGRLIDYKVQNLEGMSDNIILDRKSVV